MDKKCVGNIVMPTLYHKGKSGALYEWTVYTKGNIIYTQYGQVGGALQVTPGKVCEGKNLGKSNETTPEMQAYIEAEAMHKFKLDRKYSFTPEEAQVEMLFPMLAQDFEKKKKKLTYPVDVQPKLDGVRCIARWEGDEVVLSSRSGKPYNVPHIKAQLEKLMEANEVLDGELYIHWVDFQTITSLVKKNTKESEKLIFCVYDIPESPILAAEAPWSDRVEALEEFFDMNDQPNLQYVPCYKADSEQEVYNLQKTLVEAGYEGAIVRTRNGIYRYNYRSDDLLKVKSFDDDEFLVEGFRDGKGKDTGTVIWICKTKDGKQFDVRPKGTYEERHKLFFQGAKFIGKELKVKYFGLTNDGVPRFPIGLGFRDKKDK